MIAAAVKSPDFGGMTGFLRKGTCRRIARSRASVSIPSCPWTFTPVPWAGTHRAGGGQCKRGGWPAQMFLLAPRQLGFGPIECWLPNQSRAQIGGFLDSSLTNRRRTTFSSDHPFAASGSNRTASCQWLSMTAKPPTLAAKHTETVCNRSSIHRSRCSNPSPHRHVRSEKDIGSNDLRRHFRVDIEPLSSRILPPQKSNTTILIPSHTPTYKRKMPVLCVPLRYMDGWTNPTMRPCNSVGFGRFVGVFQTLHGSVAHRLGCVQGILAGRVIPGVPVVAGGGGHILGVLPFGLGSIVGVRPRGAGQGGEVVVPCIGVDVHPRVRAVRHRGGADDFGRRARTDLGQVPVGLGHSLPSGLARRGKMGQANCGQANDARGARQRNSSRCGWADAGDMARPLKTILPTFPCPQFACPTHRRRPFPRPSFNVLRQQPRYACPDAPLDGPRNQWQTTRRDCFQRNQRGLTPLIVLVPFSGPKVADASHLPVPRGIPALYHATLFSRRLVTSFPSSFQPKSCRIRR